MNETKVFKNIEPGSLADRILRKPLIKERLNLHKGKVYHSLKDDLFSLNQVRRKRKKYI